jgi:class 3 adenylate cyclase
LLSRTGTDKLILFGLIPFWVICQFLHIDRQLSDRPLAWVPMYVTAAPTPAAYPRVLQLWPNAPKNELMPGDELLSIGGRDMRGAGRVDVIVQAYEGAGANAVVPIRVRRAGAEFLHPLSLLPVESPWSHLLLSLCFGVSGILVFQRSRSRHAARAYSLAAIVFSLHFTSLYGGSVFLTRFSIPLLIVTAGLYPLLLLKAALLFPESTAPRSAFARRAPWIFCVTGPAFAIWLLGMPSLNLFGFRFVSACFTATIVTMLVILARNYRAGDARGRRQIRWGLYGLFVGTSPVAVLSFIAAANPEWRTAYESSLAAQALIPFFFFVGLARFDLFDIDRVISMTGLWTVLAVVALGVPLVIAPPLFAWAETQTGIRASIWIWALVLALALPISLNAPRIRNFIEGLVFPNRHHVEAGLRSLRGELEECQSLTDLFQLLSKRLVEVLGLRACAIYGIAGDTLVSLCAHGPLVPPRFDAQGPLANSVANADGPVPEARWRQWARRGLVSKGEAGELESLGARVIVPLFRNTDLAGMICLGEKGSGDIFTATELVQLESLAERASLKIAAFDLKAIEQEQRDLNEELARYAPRQVAEALRRGDTLPAHERELSVLFVDLRGYTRFSSVRSAPEIFSVVARYTNAVTREVVKHRGSVMEFHGDGLLAVFGAFGDGKAKEREAVAAAQGIVMAVDHGDLGAGTPLSCGVGIATGLGFLGHIEAVDRQLWNVIGNTVNLAARFEELTRDFDVSIVIDDLTHERCGERANQFQRKSNVYVKGRDEAFTLWTRELRIREAESSKANVSTRARELARERTSLH